MSKTAGTALSYVTAYGVRAGFRIRDDISRAIGTHDWAEAHRLQCAQVRISRLQLCQAMAAGLTADRKESYRQAY